jgi:hypothetical protein
MLVEARTAGEKRMALPDDANWKLNYWALGGGLGRIEIGVKAEATSSGECES